MRQFVFLLIIKNIITSCNPILLKLYGIKTNPKAKSKSQIVKYAIRNNFDTSILYFNNASILKSIFNLENSPNVMLVFNPKGYLIKDTSSGSCKGRKLDNLSNMLRNTQYLIDPTHTIDSLGKALTLQNKSKGDLELGIYDYYIILSWATYAGKLNRQNYQQAMQIIQTLNNIRVKVIAINLDLMKGENYSLLGSY